MGKRPHGAVMVVDDSGAVAGVVRAADCEGQDRFASLASVMRHQPLVLDAAPLDGGLRRPDGGPTASGAGLRRAFDAMDAAGTDFAPVQRDGVLAGVLTRKGALRSTLYRPSLDADGRLKVAAAVGINGDVAGRAAELLAAGVNVLVLDTAHGHQQKMFDALAAVKGLNPGVPVVAGNVVTARGDPGTDPGRGGHRQGRRGPRRHVHHAHDDGRGPAAVLRRARVLGRRAGGRRPGLGRRRRPLPARRRPGPGGRGQPGHDRLLVRRHARKPGGPAAGRRRPAVQGELRHGVGPGRAEPQPARGRLRKGPQGPVRGRHLHVPDVHGSGAARRRGPAGHDHRRAPQFHELRRRRGPRRSSGNAPWPGSSPRPATRKAGPVPQSW